MIALLGTIAAASGCGSAAPPNTQPTTPANSERAPGATLDPNAPEVNSAGDIPDNQVYVPFALPGAGLSVSVPQGWARTTQGPATVFTDKFNSVRIEVRQQPAPPTVTSVRAEELPPLQSAPGFVLTDVTQVQRSAGPAILARYQTTSAPNPVTGRSLPEAVERYEFWSAGQEAVLTLAGPRDADNVDPWRTVSDSLKWQR